MAANNGLSGEQMRSIVITVVLGVVLLVLAWLGMRNTWVLCLAASGGALGGLVHEFAQSGGKIMFFKRYDDGYYLGAIAGAVLGAVSGVLVVRGHLIAAASGQPLQISTIQLAYEVFLAGLALKGITEAAGGNPVQKT